MKITAAVTESAHAPFALQEIELGDLRPDEVLVRVAAAGICQLSTRCAGWSTADTTRRASPCSTAMAA